MKTDREREAENRWLERLKLPPADLKTAVDKILWEVVLFPLFVAMVMRRGYYRARDLLRRFCNAVDVAMCKDITGTFDDKPRDEKLP